MKEFEEKRLAAEKLEQKKIDYKVNWKILVNIVIRGAMTFPSLYTILFLSTCLHRLNLLTK